MRTYATNADLIKWMGGTRLENSASLLRAASGLIRDLTQMSIYSVDSTGLATDEAVRTALSDATCAQAAFWGALGYNPELGVFGVEQSVASESMLGSSVTYAIDKQVESRRVNMGDEVAPLALTVLRDAGLLSQYVRAW